MKGFTEEVKAYWAVKIVLDTINLEYEQDYSPRDIKYIDHISINDNGTKTIKIYLREKDSYIYTFDDCVVDYLYKWYWGEW